MNQEALSSAPQILSAIAVVILMTVVLLIFYKINKAITNEKARDVEWYKSTDVQDVSQSSGDSGYSDE